MTDPVLLTGATGFVGRAVLAELAARAIPVHAVSRQPGPALPGIIWHQADLLTQAGRAAVSGLAPGMIHCAWEVEHGRFWTSAANADWRAASVDLIGRFRATGGRRVLAVGTCAEYDTRSPGPWNEGRLIDPSTPYGQAKAALHNDLTAMCGADLIWARLFHLYGPKEDRRRFVPSLIDVLTAGHPATVRAAELVRDYASAAHVARCIVSLLQAPIHGACDIGSGQPRKLGDLARILADAAGSPSLLHLSHQPNADDPPNMAPELRRLFELPDVAHEMPEDALAQHALAEVAALRHDAATR